MACQPMWNHAVPRPRRTARRGFTIVELLIAITIILILLALLFPALSIVGEHSSRNRTRLLVSQIHQALQSYAAEERRHRFPPHAPDRSLAWSPEPAPPATAVVNMLTGAGFAVDLGHLNRNGPPPYALVDPWANPLRYQADNDLTGTNAPQRPLGCDGVSQPLAGWNAAGARPWGYVWSVGKDGTSDGRGWIFQRDSR